jgi:hypothetical protein
MTFGRTATMEVDVGRALGVDYREQPEPDDARAWELVREEVMAGRPTMLTGDILYLDYREYKVHFPAHRFVLLGFDDEKEIAWIADRIRTEPEACSYGALSESRNPPEGISTVNLWGRFHGTAVGRSLPEAARWAIERCARRMLGEEPSEIEGMASVHGAVAVAGVAGVRRLAEELPGWAGREDARWLASFNARCIEKFGNGGGNFRRLYAGFLSWARELDAGLVPERALERARQAADGWTALSVTLAAAAEEAAKPDLFREAAQRAAAIAEIEEDLFTRLAGAAAA